MLLMMKRCGVAVVMALLAIVAAETPVLAQAIDVSGAWSLEVTTDQGVTTPSMVLTQEGEEVTGSYSSDRLGETTVSGSVDGDQVTISFSADLQGQPIPIVYSGTVDGDAMSGTIDIAGGLLSGTFMAKRSNQ